MVLKGPGGATTRALFAPAPRKEVYTVHSPLTAGLCSLGFQEPTQFLQGTPPQAPMLALPLGGASLTGDPEPLPMPATAPTTGELQVSWVDR